MSTNAAAFVTQSQASLVLILYEIGISDDLKNAEKMKRVLQEDFSDLLAAASASTAFWNNEKDEVWDNV